MFNYRALRITRSGQVATIRINRLRDTVLLDTPTVPAASASTVA